MKKRVFLFLLTFLLAVSLNSCTDNEQSNASDTGGANSPTQSDEVTEQSPDSTEEPTEESTTDKNGNVELPKVEF